MQVTAADVVVVGGSLLGLTSALLLAVHGVGVMLLERHGGTSRPPRARLVTVLSMETYRAAGVRGPRGR